MAKDLTKAELQELVLSMHSEMAELKLEKQRLEQASTQRNVQEDQSVTAAEDKKSGATCGVRFYAPKKGKPAGRYYEVTWVTKSGRVSFARFPQEAGDWFHANHGACHRMITD